MFKFEVWTLLVEKVLHKNKRTAADKQSELTG
jgi:hypothetical protein